MLNWNQIVKDYIIKHSSRIQKTTRPLHEHFGIDYFTYHRIDESGKYTVLVDRPDWAEHYVQEQLFLNDPYLRHPKVYESGFCLIENHGSEDYKKQVFKSAKKVLNADVGVTLVQKKKDSVEFFGFVANKTTSCLSQLYLNHPELLKSFANHFKKELNSILVHMESEASSLITLKGHDFFCSQSISPDISLATRVAYLKDIGIKVPLEKLSQLSLRERQCIHHLMEEKSAKETADILGLSQRTIEFYFENIKNKLSCSTKKEVSEIMKQLKDLGLD